MKIKIRAMVHVDTLAEVRQELEAIRKGIEHAAEESNGYWYQTAEWRNENTFVFETFSTKGKYLFHFVPHETVEEWMPLVVRFEGYRNSFLDGSVWGIRLRTDSPFPLWHHNGATIKVGDIEIRGEVRVFETSMPDKPLCRHCDLETEGMLLDLEEAERLLQWLKRHSQCGE